MLPLGLRESCVQHSDVMCAAEERFMLKCWYQPMTMVNHIPSIWGNRVAVRHVLRYLWSVRSSSCSVMAHGLLQHIVQQDPCWCNWWLLADYQDSQAVHSQRSAAAAADGLYSMHDCALHFMRMVLHRPLWTTRAHMVGGKCISTFFFTSYNPSLC